MNPIERRPEPHTAALSMAAHIGTMERRAADEAAELHTRGVSNPGEYRAVARRWYARTAGADDYRLAAVMVALARRDQA